MNPVVGRGKKITDYLARGTCDCKVCKLHRGQSHDTSSAGRTVVAFDLFGPTTPAVDGSVYGSVAVERESNHIIVDGLHRKTSDETLAMLKRYLAEHEVPVHEIHTDGGTEWLGKFA